MKKIIKFGSGLVLVCILPLTQFSLASSCDDALININPDEDITIVATVKADQGKVEQKEENKIYSVKSASGTHGDASGTIQLKVQNFDEDGNPTNETDFATYRYYFYGRSQGVGDCFPDGKKGDKSTVSSQSTTEYTIIPTTLSASSGASLSLRIAKTSNLSN